MYMHPALCTSYMHVTIMHALMSRELLNAGPVGKTFDATWSLSQSHRVGSQPDVGFLECLPLDKMMGGCGMEVARFRTME